MKCAQCGKLLHKPYYTIEWEDYIVVVCSKRCEHHHTQNVRNKPRIMPIHLYKAGLIHKKTKQPVESDAMILALQQTVLGLGQNITLL